MNKFKKCPCGEYPKSLSITDTLSGKWAFVTPDCCGEWMIEYRNGYETGIERENLALEAWNEAPRPEDNSGNSNA